MHSVIMIFNTTVFWTETHGMYQIVMQFTFDNYPFDSHVWPTCIYLVTPSIEHGHDGKVWITAFSYKISRARLLTCSVYDG